MRAAVYRRFGAPEVVRVDEVRTPVPRRNEVLIRVRASTVSTADFRARTRVVPKGLAVAVAASLGVFRPRRRILGMDVAGVVEAVGSGVRSYAPSDEVIAMHGARFGGHAQSVCVRAHAAIASKPRNMTFAEAVAAVFGGVTAQSFLDRTAIYAGTTVLVNGAPGAVGTAAIQLAEQLGANVTAVSSSGNDDLVRALGADRVIDYEATDFTRQNHAYDVIMDCVGNAPFDRVSRSLSTNQSPPLFPIERSQEMTTTALPASDPLRLTGVMDTHLSRWLWLVKMPLAIPHFVVLAVLWVPYILTTLFAGIAILVTGRYPRPLFDLNVGILRWNWRVGFYVYAALGTDKYPPFSFADRPDYPAKFDVVYEAHPSRVSVLLRWFAAVPHLVIVAFIMADLFAFNQPSGVASAAFSLLNVFVVAAGVLLLMAGRYPQGLFDFLLGINRWVYRVLVYVSFMRSEYPPFRFEAGNPDDSLH